ncbi:ferredoxin reductase family protein [Microbacterium sediminicola]|uniref:ferredoxin reductase family protein n=1 Tax=Microbacterium sediminicola TaxID=415210 RepID=UPI0031D89201
MSTTARAAAWGFVYLLIALAPLLLSLIQLDPGRGFWVNVSVAAGFVGLSLMGLQFALATHTVRTARVFGLDILLRFHRQITVLIAVLIFAHPIILFVWDPRFLELLNPVTSPVRAKFAVLSVLLLILLIVSSIWRRKLRLRYPVWQILHSVLAVLIVLTALLHVLLIGYYVSETWEQILWAVYTMAFVALGVWVRLIQPLIRWRRRWRVVEITTFGDGAATLILELVNPASYGPRGFHFQAGQYAWIRTGGNPFAITYNPFSFASSAEHPERVAFTIKQEHGFTTTIPDLQPGSTVYLDGPWGHMTIERHNAPGFVLVAAGVGITPMLSMLTTMADRGDARPVMLLLGNRHEDAVIGRAALDDLQRRMPNLTLVEIISRPSASWTGERGRMNAAFLDRMLPADRGERQYFICAAEPVIDAVSAGLTELGVAEQRVFAERFAMG